jgi:hypothetical protein
MGTWLQVNREWVGGQRKVASGKIQKEVVRTEMVRKDSEE